MTQSAGLESGVTGRTPGDLRLAGLPMLTGATTLARGRETKVILGPPRSLFGKTCAVFCRVEGVRTGLNIPEQSGRSSRPAADRQATP